MYFYIFDIFELLFKVGIFLNILYIDINVDLTI